MDTNESAPPVWKAPEPRRARPPKTTLQFQADRDVVDAVVRLMDKASCSRGAVVAQLVRLALEHLGELPEGK